VESGLYPHERKGIVLVLPFSAIMSVLGVLFLYYLLLPACLAFMLFFNSSFPAPTLTDRSSGGWLETFIQITVSSYGMDSSGIGGDAKSDPDNKSDGNQGSTDNDNKSDDQKTNGGESSNQDAGDSENEGGETDTTDDGNSKQTGNASSAGAEGNGDEPANGTPNPADAHSGGAQPVRTWPRLRTNPDNPVDGQYWIKMPEGELRYYLDGRVRRVVPMQTNSMLGTLMDINQYLSFVTLLALGVVIAFQLPVVLLILGWSGLVSPHFLARYRKHCIFACFGVGAVFTPADPMSMMVLALPLWGLFEFGLLLMRLTYRQPEPEMMD
jgi:sec-independent protein translocase protein TatC